MRHGLKLTIWLFCIYTFQLSYVYASPPKVVFRIDDREPSSIFQTGFISWGSDHDVYRHISGQSCVEVDQSERDSGFISSSANYVWARTISIARASANPGRTAYLYQVRADHRFYNAERSLREHELTYGTVGEAYYIAPRTANEYITPDNIPTANIVLARAFTLENGRINEVIIHNQSYENQNTRASSLPYIGPQSGSQGRGSWLRSVPIFSACFYSRTDARKKGIDKVMNNKVYLVESILEDLL